MAPVIWLSLFAALVLLVLLPFVFAEVMSISLAKLHISPTIGLLIVIAVIFGGFINIPVRRIQHSRRVIGHPLAVFGLFGVLPELQRDRSETVIAVNLGGCVIPVALAIYETMSLVASDASMLGPLVLAAAINVAACYFLARPLPGVGIALPSLVPALLAVAAALLLAPGQAPPVAFVAGVAGPLIGADLLHLWDIDAIGSAVVSIGGAGTFDGIILSGILAAYLA